MKKIYRTIGVGEFNKLFFGEEIVGLTQKSYNCHYCENDEIIKASEKPNEFVCFFNENIYWFDPDEKLILLELEIDELRIKSTGYGSYFTPLWNKYINDNSNGSFVCGQFGLKRKSLSLKTKIKETFLESYSLKDISNVYFLNGGSISTSLSTHDSQEGVYFKDYASYIFSELINYNKRIYRKKVKQGAENITKLNEKYDEAIMSVSDISLNVFKKIIKEVFNNNEFVDKWHYYNDNKILDKVLYYPEKLSTVINVNLNKMELYYLLSNLNDFDFYFLENLKCCPEIKPLKMIEFIKSFEDFLLRIHKSNVLSDNFIDFIYTVMTDHHLC